MQTSILRLELHFRRRPGEGLVLEKTRFWEKVAPEGTPSAELTEKESGPVSPLRNFDWKESRGVLGLAVLFLRHFASPAAGYILAGSICSLAQSTHEVLTAGQKEGFNWAANMFGHTVLKRAISPGLFRCTTRNRNEHFEVGPGADWQSASLVVIVDRKQRRRAISMRWRMNSRRQTRGMASSKSVSPNTARRRRRSPARKLSRLSPLASKACCPRGGPTEFTSARGSTSAVISAWSGFHPTAALPRR